MEAPAFGDGSMVDDVAPRVCTAFLEGGALGCGGATGWALGLGCGRAFRCRLPGRFAGELGLLGLGPGFGEALGADRLGLPAFEGRGGEEVRECSDFFGEVSGEGRALTVGLSLGFGLGVSSEARSGTGAGCREGLASACTGLRLPDAGVGLGGCISGCLAACSAKA
mmetsp:Transcript_11350/g.26777  ORF Transcript_11350/g.26777 Transcript_11350/m.26777 type:complete len:167 (+) Transcript_11350:462-962(+)